MTPPDQHDDLHELFSGLRAAPPAVDPTQIAPGFETRVLARVHATSRPESVLWFWRWSALFGAVAVVCVVLVVQDYRAMADDSFALLDGGLSLLDWFY